MADDPYGILGVSRQASEEEIRSAYRRLVKELHPDVNPAKSAHERFRKVTAAHEIIGDPDKRRQFDRGEIDASGEPRRTYTRQSARNGAGGAWGQPGSGGYSGGFGDMFDDILAGLRAGGRPGAPPQPATGRDVRYLLEVELEEAVLGAKKRVTMPGGGVLDLTVPEGVADGQILRLKGKGSPGAPGQEPGDALVEIKIRPHAHLKRQGDDILLDLPITIDEAVLGAKVEVPTLSGRVQLSVPRGTSSGQMLRLKGKGVRNPQTLSQGDQLVTVRIVLPDKIDDELADFLAKWRSAHRYDPGRKA